MAGLRGLQFVSYLGLGVIAQCLSLSAQADSCTPLKREQIYNDCNSVGLPAGTKLISVKDTPFCAAGSGQNGNDDTAAIQSALNAALVCRMPLYFPAGYYFVTQSLYLAGHSQGYQRSNPTYPGKARRTGAEIYGTAMSMVVGQLTEPFPVLDATGLNWGKIHDLTVWANFSPFGSAGKATTAILLGVPGTPSAEGDNAMTGCNVTLERVAAHAISPAMYAVVNVGSDAMRMVKSQLAGPNAMVLSASNVTGITSKYNSPLIGDTSGSNPYQNGTMAQIYDSNFLSDTGGTTGLWIDGFDAVSIMTSYFNTSGTSTSAIQVTAANNVARTNSLHLFNVRQETNGNSSPLVYFLDLQSGVHTEHGDISGVAHVKSGAYVHIAPGASLSSYRINLAIDGGLPLIDGDVSSDGSHQVGDLINSVVVSPQNTNGTPSFLGSGSAANTLVSYNGPPWFAPLGAFSSVSQKNQTLLGTVSLSSVAPSPPGGRGLQYVSQGLHNGPGQTRTYFVAWHTPLADPQHTVINCELIENAPATPPTGFNSASVIANTGLSKPGPLFGKTAAGFTVNITNSDLNSDRSGELDCMAISQ